MKQKLNTQKLHIALTQALDDLEWIEKNPKFEVDMDYWVSKDESYGEVCRVCLAGSSMIRRTDVDIAPEALDYTADFGDDDCPFGIDESLVFRALDEVRHYNLKNALGYLYPQIKADMYLDLIFDECSVPDTVTYESNAEVFKRNMREIAEILKKHDV